MKATGYLTLAAAVGLLGACSSSGSDSERERGPAAVATGVWEGELALDAVPGQTFGVTGLIYGPELRFISIDLGAVYEGALVIEGQEIRAATTNYNLTGPLSGPSFSESEITGEVVTGESISATFTSDDGQEGSLELTYDPITDRGSSLETISGVWSMQEPGFTFSIGIDAQGGVSGSDDQIFCSYNGDISILDPDVNIYNVELDISPQGALGCPLDGAFVGFAVVADDAEEGDTLLFTVSDGDNTLVGALTRIDAT